MYISIDNQNQASSDVEATWLRQRSDRELRNFIDERHDMIDEDIDLAMDGIF